MSGPVRKKKNVHFWVPYPMGSAPSQRFRVEQYLPYLEEQGIRFRICSFLGKGTWEIYYKGDSFRKFFGVVKGYGRRIGHLFRSWSADYIFLLREASPAGPPVFEWLLARVFRKKIIYDFDDAIWIPGGEKASWLKKFLKATWKVKHIIRWSYKISCGNEFLRNYALRYNPNSFLVPTVIDMAGINDLKEQVNNRKVTVGWTGTHTTLHNLEEVETLIPELKMETEFDFLVISNKPPAWDFEFQFIPWKKETEKEDLMKMDIGIMPLKKDPWFEGKCGFKLIQYQAYGIPAIASDVGVNPQITLHEQTGFIARNAGEWKLYLKQLIADASMRTRMGRAGREHIEKHYSLNAGLFRFVPLFS